MNLSRLIEEALEERGNAVMVIGCPADGENAVIRIANAPLALILGQGVEFLNGLRLGALASLAEDPADWTEFVAAVRDRSPLRLDLKLRVKDREVWFGFGLTFKTDAPAMECGTAEGISYGIVIGRDITQSRRRALEENESQRLLASVFMRVNAAVAIVGADGTVMMANPAFHRLHGYDAGEVDGRNVDSLVAPEFATAARGARARQLLDGISYEMQIGTIAKDGSPVSARLSSALLRDAFVKRLRVITLIPDAPHDAARMPDDTGRQPPRGSAGLGSAFSNPGRTASSGMLYRSVGQLQAISLDALKSAAGDAWQRIASRAMMMAEQIVKRRLGPDDVFSRSDDNSFVIWFDSMDEQHNAAVMAAAAREIRLRFLTELGDEVAANVSAAMARDEAGAAVLRDRSARMLASPGLLDRLDAERQRGLLEAGLLLQELEAAPVADVKVVTDRDGKIKPMVVIDFPPPVRRRLFDLTTSLAGGHDQNGDIDLRRLDLALREVSARRGRGNVLVPISWGALTGFARRRSFDDSLARIDPALRSHLMLAVSDVPPLPDPKRWSELVAPLRRRLGEVGLMMTLAEGDVASIQEVIVGEWPISLLVIDATDPASVASDEYFGLIGAARRRNIAVLIRAAAPDDIRDWRELGATMFAGST